MDEKMLIRDNIYMDVFAETYQDVLSLIGQVLYEKGYVKETYTQALLGREEEFATGLPTTPEAIAIPHTDPEHVIKPCILILKLHNPVKFREMGNHENLLDVRYVFGLVFNDGRKQMPLLASIISMASDEKKMADLSEAKTEDDVMALVSDYVVFI